jgi:serine/threonine-protein kinase HipA
LPEGASDFHSNCSRKFFGSAVPPVLDYGKRQMQELAREIIIKRVAVTGVQPKLSLSIEKNPEDPKRLRFTIVGLWGGYILKPPADEFNNLPENEDLTMHLAEHFGIPTAQHSLIRLQSGELAYITKRFDRIKDTKLALEDMCQLTETLTEDKYRSSMEKVGKCIAAYSTRPGLDLITFFETGLFCFLTGNTDMHLKNFALLSTERNEVVLSPAFDLLNTKIVLPDDREEIALTINAKKNKLRKKDFDALATKIGIPEKSMNNTYKKFAQKITAVNDIIKISFLPQPVKEQYKKLVKDHGSRINLL